MAKGLHEDDSYLFISYYGSSRGLKRWGSC